MSVAYLDIDADGFTLGGPSKNRPPSHPSALLLFFVADLFAVLLGGRLTPSKRYPQQRWNETEAFVQCMNV
jgi:hypothetical protein